VKPGGPAEEPEHDSNVRPALGDDSGHVRWGEVGGYLVQYVPVVWELEGLCHPAHEFLVAIAVFRSGNGMVVAMPT
jgi:hypothetical protein